METLIGNAREEKPNSEASMRFLALLTSLMVLGLPTLARGEPAVRLQESFAVDYQYHVTGRADLTGTLTVPADMAKEKAPKPVPLSGSTAVEYDEKVLDSDANAVRKTVRVYSRMDYRRKVGEQSQSSELRPEVRRMVLLRGPQNVEVPFSPDGPLLFSEIDMVRTEIFTPALRGLLPAKEVKEGDHWQAGDEAVLRLTDLETLTGGRIACKLQEVAIRDGRRFAKVEFAGSVTGANSDGPNRQQLDGYYFFDLQSNHLSYLYLTGTSWMLDKDGKEVGRVEGRFVLTRRRETSPDLRPEALRGVALDPTPENTQLLFHEPGMGVRLVYPRRWTVRQADARQITLDEPGGGGLLITLEPLTQTPSVRDFHTEVTSFLAKQSAKIKRSTPPQQLRGSPDALDHFLFEAEVEKQNLVLDYYVAKQASGGATFAGRYSSKDAAELQKDAERIARSLQLVPPKR